jgi:hypothetical protein
MKKHILTLLGALALAALAPLASAQLTAIATGTNTGVQTKFVFTVDPVNYKLTVEVDNTLGGPVTGSVTAFGFNTPGDGSGISIFSQTWTLNPTSHDTTMWVPASPFEISNGGNQNQLLAEFGSDTNGKNGNGGNTQNAIKAGDKTVFVFQLPAFDVAQLDQFNATGPDVIVRWQQVGADGEASDFGSGEFEEPGEPLTPVPEPSTYGLLGALALVGLTVYRRVRR